MDATKLHRLPLAKIVPSWTNPRKAFDADALAELAESITRHGLLEPIVVRPAESFLVTPGKQSKTDGFFITNQARIKTDGQGHRSYDGPEWPFFRTEKEANEAKPAWEIVAGERRFRASQLAKLPTIEAKIVQLSDKEVRTLQLIENVQREDLNAIEKAEGYQELLTGGMSIEQIAADIGKSVSTVRGLLKLLNLPEEIRQTVIAGRLSINHGVLIGRIPNVRLRASAAKEILTPSGPAAFNNPGEPLSFRAARELIEEKFMIELKGTPFDRKSLTLLEQAGSCDACPKCTGNNRAEFPEGRADVCTDPLCYRAKVKNHEDAEHMKAQDRGYTVLSAKEAGKHFTSWGVAYNTPYLDLADKLPGDKQQRTVRQVLKDELDGKVVAAFDRSCKLHYLVPKTWAQELLTKKGLLKVKPSHNGNGQHSWQKEEVRRKGQEKIRDEFLYAATTKLAYAFERVMRTDPKLPRLLQAIATGVLDTHFDDSVPKLLLRYLGQTEVVVSKGKDLRELAQDAVQKGNAGFTGCLVVVLANTLQSMMPKWSNSSKAFTEELQAAAKALQVHFTPPASAKATGKNGKKAPAGKKRPLAAAAK